MGLELCASAAPIALQLGSPKTHRDLHPEEFLGATSPERGPGWGCGVVVILWEAFQ